ncbi:MAG: oligoribonuclease [Candidatus Babeliales bacterium]|nr:oligoribonuclease [Candidatus Babeliales bacterium]
MSMQVNPRDIGKQFVWIDLEMTGLESEYDVIIEIATIITDSNMNIIDQGPEFVIHQPDQKLDSMIDIVKNMHQKSGLIEKSRHSTITLEYAQQKTLEFIIKYCKKNTAYLAGNSVWQDLIFLKKYMPAIPEYLHYRIIDVSSVKMLVRSWYPQDPRKDFKKPQTHRAMSDIQESIDELKWYKRNFFIPLPPRNETR